jgi:CRISPR-associated protein Cas5/CasD subtype I-E
MSWAGPNAHATMAGDNRPTLPFPTRSGVLGIVGAAIGIDRSETGRLLALAKGARVHVRVDAPGTPLVDYHTVQGHPEASTTRQTIQGRRTYLCDASFAVVLVPGVAWSCEEIAEALGRPVFAPYLGRKCCPPASPLLLAPLVTGGADPIELFATLPRGPEELLEALGRRRLLAEGIDYYLDAADHPERLRPLMVRDDLVGPLPQQYRERPVCHVRRVAHG